MPQPSLETIAEDQTQELILSEAELWKNLNSCLVKNLISGTSLVVQWLRLHAPNAGGQGSIPGQGTRAHMPQLRVLEPQFKDSMCRHKDGKSCVPQLRPRTTK